MALEQRGSGSYYYRKTWRNGTCVSEYVGAGLLANYAAILDERGRDERTLERQSLARFIQEQRRIDRAIDDYHNAVRDSVAVELQRLGFHQYKRQWRKNAQDDR